MNSKVNRILLKCNSVSESPQIGCLEEEAPLGLEIVIGGEILMVVVVPPDPLVDRTVTEVDDCSRDVGE